MIHVRLMLSMMGQGDSVESLAASMHALTSALREGGVIMALILGGFLMFLVVREVMKWRAGPSRRGSADEAIARYLEKASHYHQKSVKILDRMDERQQKMATSIDVLLDRSQRRQSQGG